MPLEQNLNQRGLAGGFVTPASRPQMTSSDSGEWLGITSEGVDE